MACTWGSKVNGILTVLTIGVAVLVDLWDILDIKKGHTMVIIHLSSLFFASTYDLSGPLLEAFHGESCGFDPRPHRNLPIIFLRALFCSHLLWTRRYFHEPCFPRNLDRKRDAFEQSR
jgi:hypothetical protein